jgi:hypothetical protein
MASVGNGIAAVSDTVVATAYARWTRAVDLLWREVVRLRKIRIEERERERVEQRLRNLRKIVRKALSEYHRLEISRQS